MTNESILDRLRQKKRPIIAIGIVSVVVLSLTLFMLNNAVLFLTIKEAPSNSSIKLQVVKGNETKDIFGGSILVIPRGSETLLATSGDVIASSSSLSIPWYGFATKTIELKPSKNADKVAFASPDGACAAYNSELNKLLGFDCNTPDTLYDYQTPTDDIWGDRAIKELSYIKDQVLSPYLNGVIGVSESVHTNSDEDSHQHNTHVAIKATSPNTTTNYEAPSGVVGEALDGLQTYTDTSSTTNKRFALTDGFGAVYLGTPGEQPNEVNYISVEAPDSYNFRYNTTSCILNGERLLCYRGRTTRELAEGETALSQAKIEEYSFTDGLTSSRDITAPFMIETLQIAGDAIFATADSTLYRFSLEDDKYSATTIAKNITSASSDGHKLYYVRDKAAYTYNPVTDVSHLLFKSPNVNVAGLYPVDGKVFLLGPTNDSEEVVFAYELADEDYDGKKRLIDVLPLAENSINEIYANDFVGNKLFLQLYGDSVEDDEVRNLFIDKAKEKGIEIKAGDIQTNR